MSANPDYLAVFREDLLEGETLTQFSSCFDCGIHENLVEYRAARRIALGDPVSCWCQPFQGEVAEIKCHFGIRGQLEVATLSRRPQRFRLAVPVCQIMCLSEKVSGPLPMCDSPFEQEAWQSVIQRNERRQQ